MTKKRVFVCAASIAAFAFLLALPAAAQCDPTTDESCRLTPLQSRQVNASVTWSDDTNEALSDSGFPAPAAINELPLVSASELTVSASSSARRAPSSQQEAQSSALALASRANSSPPIDSIHLRMRYQDPSDASCGVQALGMALDGLGSSNLTAPTSSGLLAFLQGQGMIYDFGTGVEELAYAAGSFGYSGSFPFHGWSLATLQAELLAGRPIVAALGSNGLGQPGHFVTITGFSDDGQWIRYKDPTLGEVTTTVEEFRTLWALQGNSGVAVRAPTAQAAADGVDFLPLLAFLAGLMALISATPLGKFRLGVGGRLEIGSGGSSRKPSRSSTSTKKRLVKSKKSSSSKSTKSKKKKKRKNKGKGHSTKKSSKAKSRGQLSKPPQEKPDDSKLAAWKEQDMAEVAKQLEDKPHPADRKFASSPYTRQDQGLDLSAWKQGDMAEVKGQLNDDTHPADRKFASSPYSRQSETMDMASWKQQDMAAVDEQLKDETNPSDRILARYQDVQHLSDRDRYHQFEILRDECIDSDSPGLCMWDLTEWIYDAYNVDLLYHAMKKENNPLAGNSRELEELAHYSLESMMENPVRTGFLSLLRMETDEYWNYEPVYFSALRNAHPSVYRDAENDLRAREDEMKKWDSFISRFKKYLKNFPTTSNE